MKNSAIKTVELTQIKFDAFHIKTLLILLLFFLISFQTLQAQEQQYSKPSWWFGVAAGGNLNFYRGST
jgi:hypothetical protein